VRKDRPLARKEVFEHTVQQGIQSQVREGVKAVLEEVLDQNLESRHANRLGVYLYL